MRPRIYVTNRQEGVSIDSGKVRRAAGKILGALGLKDYELSIAIVDDAEITRLNRQYFRRNRPTNVISFPMSTGDPPDSPSRVLGDVVISVETAQRQAAEANRQGEEETLFLLIHGILHLVGYDHEGTAAERRKMEAKERELFFSLTAPGPGMDL